MRAPIKKRSPPNRRAKPTVPKEPSAWKVGRTVAYDPAGKADTAFNIQARVGECVDAVVAKAALAPETHAALTMKLWKPMGWEHDVNAIVAELRRQGDAAKGNDLGRLEATLAIQAHTLDLMFNQLAQRAYRNMGEYPDAAERYMRLALKAQSQCRSTIEGLAEIKNPTPVAFVQQANIAAGHQQVNNGQRAGAETLNRTNEILETAENGYRLERQATGTSLTGNSPLATLGQGDRTEVCRRESEKRDE